MIKPICKDTMFLAQKSLPATQKDGQVAIDLMDTLKFYSHRCVGMAANMIGVNKCIIAVNIGFMIIPMINPVIIKKSEPYQTSEGCLSLVGERTTTRYNNIEVEYYDLKFKKCKGKYTEFTAQIIQHEIDHTKGILI